MDSFSKALVGLAGLAFLLATAGSLAFGSILGVPPESFSRACTNLALLAIALSVCMKDRSTPA